MLLYKMPTWSNVDATYNGYSGYSGSGTAITDGEDQVGTLLAVLFDKSGNNNVLVHVTIDTGYDYNFKEVSFTQSSITTTYTTSHVTNTQSGTLQGIPAGVTTNYANSYIITVNNSSALSYSVNSTVQIGLSQQNLYKLSVAGSASVDNDLNVKEKLYSSDLVTCAKTSGTALLVKSHAVVNGNISGSVITTSNCLSLGELASAPSTPANGEGGKLYTKADGKLYYISNEIAEQEVGASSSLATTDLTDGANIVLKTGAQTISGAKTFSAAIVASGGVTGNVTGNASGNAATATILQTARTIGGVSFDGSANINLAGVNASGTQDTSGNAATATILQTARTIGGVSFDGSANINLAGVNSTGTQDTSGNAATATILQTARTIGGVSFDGSANINLPGVNAAGSQNTTGSAATLTTARTIGGVSFDGSANINLPGVNAAGSQNTTGSAATLTTARTIGGVSFDGSANINLPGVNAAGNQNTTGNAATVTGGVYTSGNQTVAGTKTFSADIVGSITGNAATATVAASTTNADHYPTFVAASSGAQALKLNTNLKYNPSTDTLSVANLTVTGTTTTVNSTTVTIADPILQLGSNASDDNLDRGLVMLYNDGSARKAFMGYDDSDGKFAILTAATDTSNVFTGTKATLKANLEGNADTSTTAATVTSATQSSIQQLPGVLGLGTSGTTITINGDLSVTGSNVNSSGVVSLWAEPWKLSTSSLYSTIFSAASVTSTDYYHGILLEATGIYTKVKIRTSNNLSAHTFTVTASLHPSASGPQPNTTASFTGSLTINNTGSNQNDTIFNIPLTSPTEITRDTIYYIKISWTADNGSATFGLQGSSLVGDASSNKMVWKKPSGGSLSADASAAFWFVLYGNQIQSPTGSGVFLTGNQTIAGVKTFTGTINVNNAWNVPNADGSANQVLKTDGSGNVSWADAPGGSVSASSANSDHYPTFVSGLSGSQNTNVNSALKFNPSTGLITIPKLAAVSMAGSIIPDTNDTYDIGAADKKIRDLYVSDDSMWIGDRHKISITGGKVRMRKISRSDIPKRLRSAGGLGLNITNTHLNAWSSGKNYATMTLANWDAFAKQSSDLAAKSITSAADVFQGDDDDDFDNDEVWDLNGTAAYYTGGNVGVGTTTPDFPLHVYAGNASKGIRVDCESTDTEVLRFTPNDSAATTNGGAIRYLASGSGNSDAFVVTMDGQSGGGSKVDALKIMQDGTLSFKSYTFPLADGSANQVLKTNGSGTLSWTNQSGGGSSVFTESGSNIYWNGSGNMGVGTNSPSTKLQVSGTVTATAFVGALTGNATTATTLATARTIGGVSFNGSANINLPGVNAAGNQNTTGNAATSTTAGTVTTAAQPNITSVGTLTSLNVSGNLVVSGTTTTLNSTTLVTNDVNITLGNAVTSDAGANGGGITLKGASDKTIVWDNTNSNWTSNQDWNIPTGKVYKINNASVLSATTLGSSVTSSSLTSVGNLTGLNINGAFSFPTSDGSANQVLKTNGSGTLSWTNQSGGGGGGSSPWTTSGNDIIYTTGKTVVDSLKIKDRNDGVNITANIDSSSITYTLVAGAGSLDGTGGASGTAGSVALGGYPQTKMFNGTLTNSNDCYFSVASGSSPYATPPEISFTFASVKQLNRYRIWPRNGGNQYNPKKWELRGVASGVTYNSSNASTYTVLDSRTNITTWSTSSSNSITNLTNYNEYDFTNTTSYITYIWRILEGNPHGADSAYIGIGEIALYSGSAGVVDNLKVTLDNSGTAVDALVVKKDGMISFKNFSFPIADGSANQVLKTDGSGALSWTDQSGGGGGGSSPWTTSGNNIYYTTGKVGIRTTTPDFPLHVHHDAGKGIRVDCENTDTEILRFSPSDSYPTSYGGALRYLGSGSGDNNAFSITMDNQLGTNIDAFKILQDGTISFKSYTFPLADGSADQVLKTNGSGTLSWTDGGGGGAPTKAQIDTALVTSTNAANASYYYSKYNGAWTQPVTATTVKAALATSTNAAQAGHYLSYYNGAWTQPVTAATVKAALATSTNAAQAGHYLSYYNGAWTQPVTAATVKAALATSTNAAHASYYLSYYNGAWTQPVTAATVKAAIGANQTNNTYATHFMNRKGDWISPLSPMTAANIGTALATSTNTAYASYYYSKYNGGWTQPTTATTVKAALATSTNAAYASYYLSQYNGAWTQPVTATTVKAAIGANQSGSAYATHFMNRRGDWISPLSPMTAANIGTALATSTNTAYASYYYSKYNGGWTQPVTATTVKAALVTSGNTAYASYYLSKYNGAWTQPVTATTVKVALVATSNSAAHDNYYLNKRGNWYNAGASDSRIKKEEAELDDGVALTHLRLLKPKSYKYIDQERGTHEVYGFMAQEVKTVLPYAVSVAEDAIPDILETCTVSNAALVVGKAGSVITLTNATTDTLLNKFVRMTDSLGEVIKEEITEIVDSKKFYISRTFDSTEIPQGTIKVFGTYIPDFHSLRKDHLWTLATAATQELDRKVTTLENTIAAQATAIASLQAAVSALQNSS